MFAAFMIFFILNFISAHIRLLLSTHMLPRLRMHGAILFSPYAIMACMQ